MSADPIDVNFDEAGLVPAVVQDNDSGVVLMLGYMNEESLRRTRDTGDVWFFSRSRDRLWRKGETSGNVLKLVSIAADCDGDALLVKAKPTGPVCHTGQPNCFFNHLEGEEAAGNSAAVLGELVQVLKDRKRQRPEGSYTARLFEGGVDRIGKKVIEEAGEAVIAAKNPDKEALVNELADLWFHSLMLAVDAEVEPEAIWAELRRRRG